MNNVLQGLLYVSVLAYLDDVIVFSNTLEEHLQHLEEVFQRLAAAGLKLKLSKCEFFMKQLQFLGHTVSAEGIQPDFDKIRVICEMPHPQCVKDVRAFLGMCGYYRRYVPNFADIAAPLVDLTRKNMQFRWSGDCQKAFDFLKTKLTESPILVHADLTKPYRLYTDASDYAIGAILAQIGEDGEEHVIHYLSQQLSRTQRRWAVIEKEAWALVTALRKFRQYLLGAKFTVYTDHKPLKSLFTAEMKNARIQRWGILISEYNCDIQYREGRRMKADFVSRIRGPCGSGDDPDAPAPAGNLCPVSNEAGPSVDHDATLHVYGCEAVDTSDSSSEDESDENDSSEDTESGCKDLPSDLNALRKLQRLDPDLGEVYEQLLVGETSGRTSDYTLEDEVLYKIASPVKHDQEHHLQLVVPRLLVPGVLYMMHDKHGHLGVDKTHDLIRHRYFWPNSYRDTHAYINKCFVCAQRKLKALRVPIQSMPVPNAPFMTVAMDLQGPFPETENGDRYILSLVCLFSGWPEAFPIPNKNADTIARALLTEFIPRHSCPERLISDQGSEFCNEVISILSRKMGIVRIRTSPYRPQANGKCERLHRVLNDIIAKRVAENQLDWPQHIPAALYAIRTSVHTSSKHTPFFLVHGRDPKLPIDTLLQPKLKYVGEDYVPIMIERLHRAFVEVKANLRESQKRNQDNQGANTTLPEFEIGDKVFYAKLSTEPGLSRKLANHWLPYFRIIERKSPVNYVIKHIPSNTVKLVHAAHLQRVPCDVEWDKEFPAPAEIINTREQAKLRVSAASCAAAGSAPVPVAVPARRQPVRSCRLTAPVAPAPPHSSKRRFSDSDNTNSTPKRRNLIPSDPKEAPKRKQLPDDSPNDDNKRQRLFAVHGSTPVPPTTTSWLDRFRQLVGWRQ